MNINFVVERLVKLVISSKWSNSLQHIVKILNVFNFFNAQIMAIMCYCKSGIGEFF